MDWHVWWAYFFASWAIALSPGSGAVLSMTHGLAYGVRAASATVLGLQLGLAVILLVAGAGVGAVLVASATAFTVVKVVGAAYLIWQGIRLLRRSAASAQSQPATQSFTQPAPAGSAFWQGFLTNVLNPKVGVFYVTLLPQFVVADVPAGPYIFALASIHVGLSVLWFFLLIGAARHLQRWLARPRVQTVMDRITGLVFVAFGLKLVVAQPH